MECETATLEAGRWVARAGPRLWGPVTTSPEDRGCHAGLLPLGPDARQAPVLFVRPPIRTAVHSVPSPRRRMHSPCSTIHKRTHLDDNNRPPVIPASLEFAPGPKPTLHSNSSSSRGDHRFTLYHHMSSSTSLSDPPSLAEAVVARWKPIEHRHVEHGSAVRFGPKPLTVKLLHDFDLDISFVADTSVLLLVEELHENDDDVSAYIDLHSRDAAERDAGRYSSEATLSHWMESTDGNLMRWLLNTPTFKHAVESALGTPPASDERLTCHWETVVKQGDGMGRTDKVIAHQQLSPKVTAAGEWKTSLVMDDQMRHLTASLNRESRAARLRSRGGLPEALKVFVEGTGHTAQIEIYTYPSSYPRAGEVVAEALSTLIADAWAYGDVWDARIPVVTHDGAWGFCTRPKVPGGPGVEVAEVALVTSQPSMGLWLAASALSDLKGRAETAGSWEMEDVLDDTPEEVEDSAEEMEVDSSSEELSSLDVNSSGSQKSS